MRFNKLTLSAFLSFRDTTVIDFKQFGNNLMLLFGGSGVGKTAIFDGISFALYGRGSGKDRCAGKIEDYHSDFAKTKDNNGNITYRAPLFVELEFEHDGKTYVASRQIKWGEKGKNKGFTYEMLLSCEEGDLAKETKNAPQGTFAGNASDRVTEKVVEMLGLNPEQFSQVVILAQGEFAKFLNANAQDREKILTKLVDNDNYIDFQTRLKDMTSFLRKKLEAIDKDITTNLNLLRQSETISEEEKAQYTVVDADLLVALKRNLEAKENRLQQLASSIGNLNTAIAELNNQLGALEMQNKAYDEKKNRLNEAVNKLDVLHKTANIEKYAQVLGELEKMQQVLPKAEVQKQSVIALEKNELTIKNLQLELKELDERKEPLEQLKNNTEAENTLKISKLEGRISQLEEALKVYPVLTQVRERVAQLEKELQAKGKAAQETEADFKAIKEGILKDEEQLTALGNAKAEENELKAQLNELNVRLKALKSLKIDVGEADATEQIYFSKQKREAELLQIKNACLQDVDCKQQEYLAAQRQFKAGCLAQDVRDFAQKQRLTEVECPVCHTKHFVATLDKWESSAVAPAQTALDDAKKEFEKVSAAYYDATVQTSASRAKCEEKQEKAITLSKELLDISIAWDELRALDNAQNPLAIALTECEAVKKVVTVKCEAVHAMAVQQNKLEQKLSKAKQEAPELERLVTSTKEVLEAVKQTLVEQKTELAEQQGRLTACPATKEEAAKELKLNKAAKIKLQDAINQAKVAFDQCINAIHAKQGALNNAVANREQLQRNAVKAKHEYEETLLSCSWSEEAYKQIHEKNRNKNKQLLDSNTIVKAVQDCRKYVETKRKEETEYQQTIADLTNELQGKSHIDTSELQAMLASKNISLEIMNKDYASLESDKQINLQVLTQVEQQYKSRAKKQRVMSVLEPLAEAANGSITFNRYVLEDLFCTMLDNANDRLNVLCSGQYELKPIEEGDAKKNKGLGFTVYDCINQSHREAGANSGGEKFEISLSLALGLSDIVQSCSQKASRIESLFIDEGFGTLGKEELEKTKRLLLNLSGGSRQIGVISHNTTLQEAIKNQIVVDRDKQSREGSKVKFLLDC